MTIGRKLLLLCLSIALFVLICTTVRLTTEPGDRLSEMLFNRSPVQYVTVFVFALATTLLCRRLYLYSRARRQFRKVKNNEQSWTIENLAFGENTDLIRRELVENGIGGALSSADRLAVLWKDRIRKAYEIISSLVCFLPALGIFGTMLGLHDSLYTSFAGGNAGPEAVRQFIAGLGIALDTTVLALGCALVSGALTWAMSHLENGHSEQRAGFVRKVLSDKFRREFIESKSTTSGHGHSSSSTSALRAELRILMVEILEEALSGFDQRLREVAESYRTGLETTVNGIFSEQRAHEQALVEKIASQLGDSVINIQSLMERHTNRAVKTVASGLRRLSKTIDRRIPGEVVIRYNGNGESELENEDDR